MSEKKRKPRRPARPHGPDVPPPSPDAGLFDPSLNFRKVTVNGVRRWMWETGGGHGLLVPDDSDRVIEQSDGTGRCIVPLAGFTCGVLYLQGDRARFGSTPDGRMFQFTLVEGWAEPAVEGPADE